MNKGFVYILTNPSFREDWVKIGMSSRSVEERAAELYNTSLPLPFEIYASLSTVKYREVEQLMHFALGRVAGLRINDKREFFNVGPSIALEALRLVADCIDDAVLDFADLSAEVRESVEEEYQSGRRSRFTFSAAGVPVGAELEFWPDPEIKVHVVSDSQVEFEGRYWRLSPLVRVVMPETHARHNDSGAYQGSLFFKYQGQILEDLRREKEENL